jgi:hypothetical protein
MSAIDDLNAAFPWLARLGLTAQLQQWAVEGYSGEALLGLVRQTEQYQELFPAIKRDDGTLRMNEAQYLQRSDEYRQVLRSYGSPEYRYDSPWDVAAFFEQDVSPDELDKRYQVYDYVTKGGADAVRDSFYVYAGMNMSDDDLYTYVVNGQARQQFDDEYNQRVASQPLDYQTWVTRAAELGLSKVMKRLQDLQGEGIVTGTAINQVSKLDPEFARSMMDVLYTGGDTTGSSGFLGLNELMNAFEYALIGGAAVDQGLNMPSIDRVRAIRNAGIDRAKALESYSSFAQDKNRIAGMVQRAGGGGFGQAEFEEAVFLQSAEESELLRRAQRQEEALGRGGGGAGFSQQGARLTQRGLRSGY